jgi:hypothetical protein
MTLGWLSSYDLVTVLVVINNAHICWYVRDNGQVLLGAVIALTHPLASAAMVNRAATVACEGQQCHG